MFRETSELIVSNSTGFPIQDKHARSRPVRQRLLRNEFFWKMKIEVRDQHETTILPSISECIHHGDREYTEKEKSCGSSVILLRPITR